MTCGFRLFQLFEFFQEDWDIRREDQTDIRVWEVSDPVYNAYRVSSEIS
jgi:hypothetical protein